MTEAQTAATLEKPEDAGKGASGVVSRWVLELELADKAEKDWRKAAKDTVDRYRDESNAKRNVRKGRSQFNILWANTELLKPSLYSNTPRPDVRRRYRDPDPVAKAVAETIERAAAYSIDIYDFDHVMKLAIGDYLLTGRAATRVRYTPSFTGEGEAKEVVSEKAECEHVAWNRFRHGPAETWESVPWIAFEWLLTKGEIEDKFPGKEIELDVETKGEEDSKDEHDLFKRGRVWEIWDKDTRSVIWIAPSTKEGPVKEEADPLKLRNFWPIPRPLYSIETSGSLVPVEEYRLYKDQADELDEITHRIRRLVSALKVRGIYDATLKELGQLLESGDNQMVPSEGAQHALAQTQTLERHIWMLPIETIAKVLGGLYEQREQLKQVIYEITGISDILRGSSNPNETLGAQQLKAQTGSLRLQARQRDVQRYARDLIEMKIEIMCEHFDHKTLTMMTGTEVTQEGLQLLRDGGLRDYRIDIETDSTISADAQSDQEQVSKLLVGISSYFEAIGPVVQSGAMPMEAAKSILVAAVRKFKFGREVEDQLEAMGQEEQGEQEEQGPDPQMIEQIQSEAMEQAQAQVAQEREMVKSEAVKVKAEKDGISSQVQQAQSEDALRKRELTLQENEAKLNSDRMAAQLDAKQAQLDELEGRVTGLIDQADATGDDVDSRADRMDGMETDMKEMAQALSQLAQVLAQGMQANQESTQALLSAMTAPKELVRDDQGRVTGARTRLDS